MPFWSDKRIRSTHMSSRGRAPYRRHSLRHQLPASSAIRRWFFCALVMLAVTALNFLPFQWASTCKTYLAYCFQPGAAVGTEWAAWADWQSDEGMLVAVWQRIIGGEADEGFVYPCTGQIISSYAWRHHPITGQVEMHYGIDIQGLEGTPILAAASGQVREVAEEQRLGLYVTIDHGDGVVTRYAHLAEVMVEPGAQVAKGQQIAKMGNSGLTNDTHLHFEVIVDGQPVDPLSVLPR